MRFSKKKLPETKNATPLPNVDLRSDFDYSVEIFLVSLDLLKDSFNQHMDRADWMKELSEEDLTKLPGAKILTAIWFTRWLEAQSPILHDNWFDYDQKMMQALGSFFNSLKKSLTKSLTQVEGVHFPHKTQEEATTQFLPDDQNFTTVSWEESHLYVYPRQELIFHNNEELERFILHRNLVRSMPYAFELASLDEFRWDIGVKAADGVLIGTIVPVLLKLQREYKNQPSGAKLALTTATQILSAKMLFEWCVDPTRESIGRGKIVIE